MSNSVKAFLFRTNGTSALVQYENICDISKWLEVDEWSCCYRRIHGEEYVIFIDDIGFMRDNVVVTAYYTNGEPALVGNLLIAHRNTRNGQDESITEEQFQQLTDSVLCVRSWNHKSKRWVESTAMIIDGERWYAV